MDVKTSILSGPLNLASFHPQVNCFHSQCKNPNTVILIIVLFIALQSINNRWIWHGKGRSSSHKLRSSHFFREGLTFKTNLTHQTAWGYEFQKLSNSELCHFCLVAGIPNMLIRYNIMFFDKKSFNCGKSSVKIKATCFSGKLRYVEGCPVCSFKK